MGEVLILLCHIVSAVGHLGLIVACFILRRPSWLPVVVGLMVAISHAGFHLLLLNQIIDDSLVFQFFVQLFGSSPDISAILNLSLLMHNINPAAHISKLKMRSRYRANVPVFVNRWSQNDSFLENVSYLILIHFFNLIII